MRCMPLKAVIADLPSATACPSAHDRAGQPMPTPIGAAAPFYIDEDPVTDEAYERCRGVGVCPTRSADAARRPGMAPRSAVRGLPIAAAAAYCEGLGKRLPTPLEWQRAGGCDAGRGGPALRCAVAVERAASIADRAELPYARQLGRKYVSRARKGKNCKAACRRGAAWIECDPVFAEQYGRPPSRTASGYVIDDTYKDAARVETLLRGYADLHPDITRLIEIGTSHQGRPILALRVTDQPSADEDEPAVLLDGAHHGDELLAVDYALDALQRVLEQRDEPRVERWIRELDLWFVPLVNPDGNQTALFRSCKLNSGRKNGRDTNGDGRFALDEGVDLNRNYPFYWGMPGDVASQPDPAHHHYRGPRAASEPEVIALIDLARRYHFVGAISWHTNASKILSPYTIRGLQNIEPDTPWLVAEEMRAAMGPVGRRKFSVAKDLYPVDGVDQDWHFNAHGTLAYIVEGSHHNPQSLKVRRRSVEMVRPIFGALLDRILGGPAVHGTVVDGEGSAVEAAVSVQEIRTFLDERWTSRLMDGRFEYTLPRPGTYTVVIAADGFVSQTIEINVADGRRRLDVVLQKEPGPASDAP